MNNQIRTIRTAIMVGGFALSTHAAAQVTLYEHEGFRGRSFTTNQLVVDFARRGFNDRASSVIVRGNRWEVCQDSRFRGHCVVLRPGRYHSISAMGLNDRISSVRALRPNDRVADDRFAPLPPRGYDARRRNNERLFEADVRSVRAVMVSSGQRCWIEREEVASGDSNAVPGAIVGAIIGGILGHQIGGGSGQDIATAGGAVAGAAVGARVGSRSGQETTIQDVQRCDESRRRMRPAYWNVTYHFRGQIHTVQMAHPPGRTITVNARGEPRA